jgi:hypothetical protein
MRALAGARRLGGVRSLVPQLVRASCEFAIAGDLPVEPLVVSIDLSEIAFTDR